MSKSLSVDRKKHSKAPLSRFFSTALPLPPPPLPLRLNFPGCSDNFPIPIYYPSTTHLPLKTMILVSHDRGFSLYPSHPVYASHGDFLSFFLQPPQDLFSEESDTASVTSSITSPKMERKFKKTKYNVQPRIDTNLTPKRKEKVAKSSAIATPRLRLTTPIPYDTSRSRDPSPARGASRSREPSPARNAKR